MPDVKKLAMAVFGSLLLHAFIIIAFFLCSMMFDSILKAFAAKPAFSFPKRQQVVVVMQPRPQPAKPVAATQPAPPAAPAGTPRPAKPNRTQILTTSDGVTPSTDAPKGSAFESDVNSIAISTSAPDPTADPSIGAQEGRADDRIGLKNREWIESATAVPQPAVAPPAPSATPLGITEVRPTPVPTPGFQPTPAKKRADRDRLKTATQVAMAKRAEPRPTPAPKTTPKPAPTPALRDVAAPPAIPGMGQSTLRKTRERGGAIQGDQSSVNAIATPLGRYSKMAQDIVNVRWNHYISRRLDLMQVGETRIEFYVAATGAVSGARVIANSSTETFANYCLASITESTLPPLPPELAATVPPDGLYFTWTFRLQ